MSAQPIFSKQYTDSQARFLLQKLHKNLQHFDLSTPGFLRVSFVLIRSHLILC